MKNHFGYSERLSSLVGASAILTVRSVIKLRTQARNDTQIRIAKVQIASQKLIREKFRL